MTAPDPTLAPVDSQPSPVAQKGRSRTVTTDLALVSAFAALIAAATYVGAIPVGSAGVPITLGTLAVMLTGCLLGPSRGFAAVALYLGLGAIGLPVFSEHRSGLGVFTGPSGGYLLSFPIAALLGGFLVSYVAGPRRVRAAWIFACSLAASILVIHPMGIVGMKTVLDLTWTQALKADMVFWIGDLLKTTVVALIASEVHRAFPRLLDRRAR